MYKQQQTAMSHRNQRKNQRKFESKSQGNLILRVYRPFVNTLTSILSVRKRRLAKDIGDHISPWS